MTYKTILIHLNNDRRAEALVEHGAALAEAFEAHLVGLYVLPAFRLTPPIPMPYAKELAGTLWGELQDEQNRIRDVFEQLTRRRAFPSEWRPVISQKRPVGDVVIEHARAGDLVLASQADPNWGFSDIIDCPDRLAVECGRPVLVLPLTGKTTPLPRSAVVAWNGSREATRALFDALPLLQRCETVEIITVSEGHSKRDGSYLPDTEIASTLARHGVNVNAEKTDSNQFGSEHVIRSYAEAKKADLLVMGAYGHARFSEFVFGGATRHLLKEMTIPVLFSH